MTENINDGNIIDRELNYKNYLFLPYDDPKNLMKFYDELSSILKLIEYFKLNETIR